MTNRITPIENLIYNRIKFFTEKKDWHCCKQSNNKFAELFNCRKETVSRAINKLNKLGYIVIENDDGRILKSTDKEFNFNYIITNDNQVINNDIQVITDDKQVNINDKLINLKSLLNDNQVITVMTIGSSSDDNSVNHINTLIKDIIKDIINISKKLEKSSKDYIDLVKEEDKELIKEWLSYRKQIKKPYQTERGFTSFYNKLIQLSNNNQSLKKQLIDQSINKEWQDIFPIKEEKPSATIINKLARI